MQELTYCDKPMRRFAKFGSIFRTNVLFNPMVVVTDETEVERLLKVHFPCHSLHEMAADAIEILT